MYVNNFEIVNILFAVFAIYFIYKGNKIESLIAFAGYFCIHYAHLYIPVVMSSFTLLEIHKMRIDGAGILSKILQILVIGVFLIKTEFLSKWNNKKSKYIYIVINILMLFGFIADFIYTKTIDWLKLQYYLTLCLFVWIVFLPNKINKKSDISIRYNNYIINILIFILILAIIFGLYEVWLNKAWAQTQIGFNVFVYRSSSIFYNPNLFAYLCSLLYMGLIFFTEHEKTINIKNHSIALLLLFAIFITGSRGVYLFLIFSITVIILLNKKFILIYSYPFLFYILCAIVSFFSLIELITPDYRINLIENFYYLAQRFFNIPFDITRFLIYKFSQIIASQCIFLNSLSLFTLCDQLSQLIPSSPSSPSSPLNTMDTASQASIEGRFCTGCDNGWSVLKINLGLLGILSFIIIYINIIYTIIKSNNKYMQKTTAIGIILFIILVSSTIRFQILFVSVVTASLISLLLISLRNEEN
jgi:hypothetical protein